MIKSVDTIKDVNAELIFVNDDPLMNPNLLKSLQKTQPITIINMTRRFGVMPCVLAGMANANGDAVIYMDADLQDPPELIPQLVEKFMDGADVVHTRRTQRDGETRLKMWLTKKAYKIINLVSDMELPENSGDFKLLSKRVVKEILEMQEYDPYMRGLSVWVGFRQEFVEYRRDPRLHGNTQFPLWSGGPVREFLRGITANSAIPLYLSFYIGLATSLFAVVLIIYALVTKLSGLATQGVSGVLIAIAFFSGIILVCNGMMGLYIARIYNQVRGRPRYIIKEKIDPNARVR